MSIRFSKISLSLIAAGLLHGVCASPQPKAKADKGFDFATAQALVEYSSFNDLSGAGIAELRLAPRIAVALGVAGAQQGYDLNDGNLYSDIHDYAAELILGFKLAAVQLGYGPGAGTAYRMLERANGGFTTADLLADLQGIDPVSVINHAYAVGASASFKSGHTTYAVGLQGEPHSDAGTHDTTVSIGLGYSFNAGPVAATAYLVGYENADLVTGLGRDSFTASTIINEARFGQFGFKLATKHGFLLAVDGQASDGDVVDGDPDSTVAQYKISLQQTFGNWTVKGSYTDDHNGSGVTDYDYIYHAGVAYNWQKHITAMLNYSHIAHTTGTENITAFGIQAAI